MIKKFNSPKYKLTLFLFSSRYAEHGSFIATGINFTKIKSFIYR